MAVPHERRHDTARRTNDDGQAQTRTLGVLVAVMVVAGVVALILTLVGGNDSNKGEAAGQPSGSQVGNQTSTSPSATLTTSAAPTSATPTSVAPSTVAPTTAAPSTPAAAAPKTATSAGTSSKVVKYTVKRGDNLTLIAKWFNQRGYGSLYDWNKSVIGQNPNLIFAGQTIIVSLTGSHMNVSTSK